MKNAVIYARYSSAGQRDVSIDDQVREISRYAETHDYTIIKVYADRAMTGRNDKRPQFRKMIADSAKHAFQAVLVYKHDRFARNQYDSIIYKKRLSDNGVKLIAVMEPIPEGHGAMILESIYVAMAQEYSENLSQNVKRGMHGNALNCLANHIPAFGYRINKETRKYDVDPETAPIVQTIYRMTLEGKTQNEVLEYLRSIGRPHSIHWLYHVLKNERYTGVYIYDDVRVEGGMPQIISKEDYEKVRSAMSNRKHKPQLKPYTYLFSGKIYCGYCKKLMAGESATSHTGTLYRYYTCTASKRHEDCTKKRIKAELLEEKVCEALRETLFRDDVLDRLTNDVAAYINVTTKARVSELEKRLKDTEKRIFNIRSNIERVSNIPETLIERLGELEETKKELSARIEAEQLRFGDIQKDNLKAVIKAFDSSDNKSLINTFVTKLTVYDDYAIVEYDASGDNEVQIDFVPTTIWRSGWDSNPRAADG